MHWRVGGRSEGVTMTLRYCYSKKAAHTKIKPVWGIRKHWCWPGAEHQRHKNQEVQKWTFCIKSAASGFLTQSTLFAGSHCVLSSSERGRLQRLHPDFWAPVRPAVQHRPPGGSATHSSRMFAGWYYHWCRVMRLLALSPTLWLKPSLLQNHVQNSQG